MTFLIDEQLPPALAEWLRQRGHDAVHVQEIGLLRRSDVRIAETAARLGAVIVTKDEDFAQLALRRRAIRVLRLRIGNVAHRVLLERLAADWDHISERLSGPDILVEAC